MPLQPGVRLGPYEIAGILGAGGMGEVYRARDPRLARDVAVKVLPAAFSADPERLQRFDQEARAAAALNHPNILAVYDIGTHDGLTFIVSELLEGQTLGDRLREGPLPVRAAVEAAVQLAHGLAAAHDKKITHRDLKPGNVFLTKDGRIKILDFGLAKLTQGDPARAGASVLPTVAPLTAPGFVLGTIEYMSPEQVRGIDVDHRTDIFALGVVLFELLTGRRAFHRDTAPETMTAILREDVPELQGLAAHVPPPLEQVLRRCVEKDPARRFQSAQDLGFALTTLGGAIGSSSTTVPPIAARSWRRLPGMAAAVVGLAAVGAVLATFARSGSPDAMPVRRVTISLPADAPLVPSSLTPLALGATSVAISPDGSRLVYVANGNRTPQLIVRDLDRFESRILPGTDGAQAPFFAPDGQSVGFFSRNTLKTVSLLGGDPVAVSEARHPHHGAWLSDGSIVFSTFAADTLLSVPSSGGVPKTIRGRAENMGSIFMSMAALPETQAVVIETNRTANPDSNLIEIVSLQDGARRVIVRGGTLPSYASGRLLFLRSGSLLGAPFDLRRMEVTGTAVPLVEGVRMEASGHGQYAVSRDGTLIYVEGGPGWQGAPVWVRRDGSTEPIGAAKQAYGTFALSPDGRRLAIVLAATTDDVWVYEIGRGTFSRLTQNGTNSNPIWSSDGHQIAYTSIRGNESAVVSKAADGSGTETLLWKGNCFAWGWSPDGRTIALSCRTERGDDDIFVLPLDGDRRPRPFASTPFNEWAARFSPDGKWLAYTSDESGNYEVYVQPYPGPGGRWQISSGGGEEPVWSRDGREIFYRNGVKFMAAAVRTTPEFTVEPPRVMFEGPYVNVPGYSHDVGPDGRFVLIRGADEVPITRFNLVMNWFTELNRLIPVD